MTLLKVRIECDICGARKSVPGRRIGRWDIWLEIKPHFKMKQIDVCPRCQKKDPPKDRIFVILTKDPPAGVIPEKRNTQFTA